MIRRIAIVVAALALVIAACGGGDETTTEAPGDGGSTGTTAPVDTQPASTGTPAPADTGPPPPTTSGSPIGASGDFCGGVGANEALIDGIDFFSTDLEAATEQWLEALAAAEAAAPPEIAADIAVLAAAAREFVALLTEAGFDPTKIDFNDPRLAALEDGSLDTAADNIVAFCGGDPGDGAGAGGGSGGLGDDPLPDYMTEDVVVPGLIGVDDNGAAGLNIGTTLSFAETVAFYEDALGATGISDGNDVTINAQYEGATWIVLVQAVDPVLTVVTILRF